jgi:phosphoglycerate dehydrogenase-like enzyme
MKIVILDGHAVNRGDLSWDALRSVGELQVFDRTAENEVVTRAREADVVLTTRTPLSAQTLRQLKLLRYIGVIFTGYDLIDLQAARTQYCRHERSDLWYRVGRAARVRVAPGTLPSRRAPQPSDSCRRVVAIP